MSCPSLSIQQNVLSFPEGVPAATQQDCLKTLMSGKLPLPAQLFWEVFSVVFFFESEM